VIERLLKHHVLLVIQLKRNRTTVGSDIHVMLALRRSSRQVVVAYEELDGTDMIGQLLGE
jgi:hypothetical protein